MSSLAVRVCEADRGHLGAIARLEQESLPGPWSAPALAALLAHPSAFLLVAVRCSPAEPSLQELDTAEHVVGYASVQWVVDEAELLRLAVAPSHRRDSVGRRLVGAVLEQLGARGVLRLHLEVRAGNRGARAFYQRLGFSELGRRPKYYGDGEEAVILGLGVPSFRRSPC